MSEARPIDGSSDAQPFRIAVPQSVLDDLQTRLERVRWPDEIADAGWSDGVDARFLRELITYWRHDYDWRAQEKALNLFPQFRATVGGNEAFGLHFIHARAEAGGSTSNGTRLPVVLLHGWPGLFCQMTKLIPLLTDPASHGGDSVDAFDVVVPSLPGFGFSDHPHTEGMTLARMAVLIDELMTEVLGYSRYVVAGGDIGNIIARQLAGQFPERVVAIATYGDSPSIAQVPSDLSAPEQDFLEKAQHWMQNEGAYIRMQATKPQTAAIGLNDSPAGLAAWITEKYRAWSDCASPDGARDVLRRFSRDELLTFVMIYWVTETIDSSMRAYYENAQHPSVYSPPQRNTPLANSVWPGDICQPPREWAARRGHLVRYTVKPRGGHFPEWEEPQLVAEELRAFFGPFRGE